MNKLKQLIPILFLLISHQTVEGQQSLVDSLTRLINTTPKDTNHVNWRNKIAWETMFSNPKDARNQSEKALAIALKNNWEKGVANCYHTIAYTFFIEGNNSEALAFNNKALQIRIKNGDKSGIAKSFGNIGTIYNTLSQYPKALEYQLKSLKINEELKNSAGIASCLSNIGNIYSNLKKPSECLKYQLRALDIRNQLMDNKGIAGILGNIGNSYSDLTKNDLVKINMTEKERLDKVHFYKYESLKKWMEIGQLSNIALANINIGDFFSLTSNNDSALFYYQKALTIYSELNDQRGTASALARLGNIYFTQKNITKAEDFLNRSIPIAQKEGALNIEKDASEVLSKLYSYKNNPTKALYFYKKYIELKEGLINEENSKKIVQQEMQYDFDKKTTADSIKNVEQLKHEELKHEQAIATQRTYTYGGIIGFILMIIVAVIFINANTQKRKTNKLIALQKETLEIKQKEIIDSIQYAQRIQQSLLPTEKYIDKNLNRLKKGNTK